MAIITISRLTGSGGREIATATAEALGFQFIDREKMETVIDEQFPVRFEEMNRIKKDPRVYGEMVRSAIAEVARKHNVVILGSGAQFLFAKVLAALHVQIVAPLPYRIARVMRFAKVDKEGAEQIVRERDEAKRSFLEHLYSADWRDPSHYDLVLNIDQFSNDIAVNIIIEAAKAKGIEAQTVELPTELREEILTAKLDVAQLAHIEPAEGKLPEFAHSSEREFARVMDFYRIRWQYEPRTFPIEWDEKQERDIRLYARLLSAGPRPVHRTDDDEAESGHEEESQGAASARALSGSEHQDPLRARLPKPDLEIRIE